MSHPAWIEIDASAVTGDAAIAPMLTANLTKGLFNGQWLALPQFPGWYVPERIAFEPLVISGAAAASVAMGDSFYSFSAKAEAYRAGEIKQVLDALLALSQIVTVQDYCYLGGGGTLSADGQGRQYKTRTGRLTLNPPQNPGMGSDGRIIYFEPMELQFEEV